MQREEKKRSSCPTWGAGRGLGRGWNWGMINPRTPGWSDLKGGQGIRGVRERCQVKRIKEDQGGK